MISIANHYGCGHPEFLNYRGFLAGVECEVEAVSNPQSMGRFTVTNDGSLRNEGYEFISTPASRENLVEAFKSLHQHLKFMEGSDPFSVRTSTHVHVNCLNLDLQQVRILVLLYALFEEFFFMMVKPERRDNIHCVPLTETHMPGLYKHPLPTYVKNWHKYTALNLKRLSDLGTVEFRHLHGTNNISEFNCWLSVLENLWTLAQQTQINKDTLSKENITGWFNTIFQPSPRILSMRTSLFDIIRNSLIDVKFSV